MKIYNTLSKQKEEFIPLYDNYVTMYVCGPTVYDYFHIGNARSFIMGDMLRRYLEYKGYKVKYAMNLTDVDDKIINKANDEKTSTDTIAQKYIDAFFDDLAKLKVKTADVYPKATEHMNDMIELVKDLEEKGTAYNVNGNVFYDVSKFKDYGKLSGKKIDELESGSRVEVNDQKRNPLDFALWKKAKDGEPFWESPWGKGRPGWHLECSAMSMKHLGKTIDIHAGGNDLIFPHHENEIAQSEACCTDQFVRYWVHFGFLNFKEEKMSKSLGNFFTAREILKNHSAEAIRLLFAQTHYHAPLNFSKELLEASEKGLEKLNNLIDSIVEIKNSGKLEEDSNKFSFSEFYLEFEQAMDDDLNTPRAVAVIFDFIKHVNKLLTEYPSSKNLIHSIEIFLNKTTDDVLGICNVKENEKNNAASLEPNLIEILIGIRADAKKNKNFELADKIRNDLAEIGIILKDSKDGTTYTRKNI
ncbi:MAG: cysteine--tRNA ligase [Melioribacteraceae bacterium]|nr:cysteine--tRNA ligase [Melioribacteraceae bacterium]